MSGGEAAEHALREVVEAMHEAQEGDDILDVLDCWERGATVLLTWEPGEQRLFRALVRADEVLAEQLSLEMEP